MLAKTKVHLVQRPVLHNSQSKYFASGHKQSMEVVVLATLVGIQRNSSFDGGNSACASWLITVGGPLCHESVSHFLFKAL